MEFIEQVEAALELWAETSGDFVKSADMYDEDAEGFAKEMAAAQKYRFIETRVLSDNQLYVEVARGTEKYVITVSQVA